MPEKSGDEKKSQVQIDRDWEDRICREEYWRCNAGGQGFHQDTPQMSPGLIPIKFSSLNSTPATASSQRSKTPSTAAGKPATASGVTPRGTTPG
eukprot:CAMPEP_0195070814 /NCGR_PEP_ID=MMETSP0448-20130528/14777_1 /TAXON_ID=66468 /ORGANISM="Heterocapsa triquestra, Strain CCMP 448" /LENGTH=93 /DNA_ID=CAMNT_0040102565 /DNA_START=66 /DNA_END=343 /DNA_ORIENTATION=-